MSAHKKGGPDEPGAADPYVKILSPGIIEGRFYTFRAALRAERARLTEALGQTCSGR